MDSTIEYEQDVLQQQIRYGFSLLLKSDRSIGVFRDYLKTEYAEENILFWCRVDDFESSFSNEDVKKKSLKKEMRDICDQFIKNESTQCINISKGVREDIAQVIETASDAIPKVFDRAIYEVEKLMSQGAFPRFSAKVGESVKESWAKLKTKVDVSEIGKILFMNWFSHSSDVMPLFVNSISQYEKMMLSIIEHCTIVLGDLKNCIPALVELGIRHRGYGAKEAHFKTFGIALNETFEELMKDQYTPEVEKHWSIVYEMVSSIMLTAVSRSSNDKFAFLFFDSQQPDTKKFKGISKMGRKKNDNDGSELTDEKMLSLILELCARNESLEKALVTSYQPEHLEFWKHVNSLHEMETRSPRPSERFLLKMETNIFKLFIADGGIFRTAFPLEVEQKISAKLSTEILQPSSPRSPRADAILHVTDTTLFDEAFMIVEKWMLQRPFPRFNDDVCTRLNDSWKLMKSTIGEVKFGKLLFMNFFQKASGVMPLFHDIHNHGLMFVMIMELTISALDNLKLIIPKLIKLGARHSMYGANSQYFDLMGNALVQTIKETLKDKCTSEIIESWGVVFWLISQVMNISMSNVINDPEKLAKIKTKLAQSKPVTFVGSIEPDHSDMSTENGCTIS